MATPRSSKLALAVAPPRPQEGQFATVFEDVTQQRRAEQKLQRQHERFLAILGAFPEVLYVSDPATHEVLFVNDAFAEALGHDPAGEKCYQAFQGFDAR